MGRLAQGGRDHHVDRIPHRDRCEVERVAARRATPPPRRQRPRGRYHPAAQRRHAVSHPDGNRRRGPRGRRLPDGPRHRARRSRRGDPPGVRTGGGCQQQSRQPDHQHPFVRRRSARRGAARRRDHSRHPRQRHARHRQAFPRARRYRDGLAPLAPHDHRRLDALRHARTRPVPRRDRRRSRCSDVRPHRASGARSRGATSRHAGTADSHRYPSRFTALRRRHRHRCAQYGRDRAGSRRRRSPGARLPRRL